MKKNRLYGLLILLLCSGMTVFAQQFPNLQFERLTIKDGLSSDAVSSIAEDKTGFLWIGTANGLNRYDGFRFKYYFHDDEDSNSIIHNSIQKLYCDSKGRLWISTTDGVSCFLPGENRFVNYNSRFKKAYRLKNNSSANIYEDEAGTIWICNQLDFICKVNEDFTLEPVQLKADPFTIDNQEYKGYYDIYRDRNKTEWAFTFNRIYRLNKKTKQPDEVLDFTKTIRGYLQKMMQDEDGNYWVGTWGFGVFMFDPLKKELVKSKRFTGQRVVTGILEWRYQNNKWLVFKDINNGLYLTNNSNPSARNYSFIPGDPYSLQGVTFNSIYTDHHQNLWIGSNSGLQKVTAQQNSFTILPVTDSGFNNYDMLKSGVVFSYYETDSSIWLSKRYVSTFEYDKHFTQKHFYINLYPLSEKKYRSNMVAYYFFKHKEELLISVDSGLVILNPKLQQSKLYYPSSFSSGADLRTIVSFNKDEVLIRSFGFGLFVFNTATKKFTKWYSNKDTCAGCMPATNNYLFKTRENEIYVSTGGKGLFQYNKATDQFLPVILNNDGNDAFKKNYLYGMDEDEDGKLWILSTDGIYIYNTKNKIIEKHITEKGKLGLLQRICFDDDDNAWVTGASGIWCYLRKKEKWINFNAQDGLHGSDFESIIAKRSNGDIVVGLEGAIAIFNPAHLLKKTNEPPVIITEANVAGTEFSLPLQTGIDKKISIKQGQNSFSVDFALLNYLNPVSSRYYYKLEPLMKSFLLNKDGHINFTGLSPGTYQLYVKAGDKAGNIFSRQDNLTIFVEPGWYQTNGFKILCAILTGLLIYYFVKRRITNIRNEAALKQKIAETEMQALRAQMNPHFIFNSLNSIENFIMQNEKRLASDYLNKFAKLIRMILDSSRNEIVPIAKDMEALQLYIDLEQLRFNNKFSYNYFVDPVLLNGDYRVPSLIIQPYVENAIVHGLSHSEETDLHLMINVTLENNCIKYIIRDNGIGFKKSSEYNFKNKPAHKSVGLKITETRIGIFNRQADANGSVKITDLLNEKDASTGTRVEIKIKVS